MSLEVNSRLKPLVAQNSVFVDGVTVLTQDTDEIAVEVVISESANGLVQMPNGVSYGPGSTVKLTVAEFNRLNVALFSGETPLLTVLPAGGFVDTNPGQVKVDGTYVEVSGPVGLLDSLGDSF